MDSPFLGNGWTFPILPDASGKLAYVAGDDNVEQSLALLLMTQLNERVMRPTFGCAAPSYIFAPGSVQFLNLLQETVSDALTLWEPRVDVLWRGRRGRPGRPVAGDGLGELPGMRDQLAVEPGLPVLPGIDRGTVMTLDPVVLDDLTWNDFNAAALQRIPAASGGLWTLNAPVDPGITLLDLFGWLLEQRVYWMDQVSDPLTRALLKLMGITPNPAVAATTVLHVKPQCNTGETPNAVVLKQGSLVQLSGSLNPPAFTTGEEVTLYPLAQATTSGRFRAPAVTLKVGNLDRSVDLAQGRAPALLDPNGHDTTIVISLSPLAPAPVAGTLSLFFELLTPPGLESGWFPNAPTKPLGPNALTWLATINGTLTPLDSTQVVDGTLGLRRSGIVQLPIPALWTAEPNTAPIRRASATRSCSAARPPAGQSPPRVSRLIPNVVSAVHSRPATGLTQEYIQSQVANWRRLPGNVIVLPEEERPALASTLKVSITGPGQKTATDWTQVDDLGTAGPDDLVYVLDAASAKIRFGNGVTGRLPIPNDPSSVNVSYSVGGGVAGNLASSLPWTVTTGGSATLKAWNVVPSTGGQDAETLEAVRQRAPEVLKSIGRAITIADFEEVATQVPGTTVARAVAAVGRHPDFPNQVVPGAVTVFLVPDVPRKSDGSPDYGTDTLFPAGPVADAPTIAAVLDALNSARMITSEVFVAPANYRQVAISLTVSATPSDPKAMTTALNQAPSDVLRPPRRRRRRVGLAVRRTGPAVERCSGSPRPLWGRRGRSTRSRSPWITTRATPRGAPTWPSGRATWWCSRKSRSSTSARPPGKRGCDESALVGQGNVREPALDHGHWHSTGAARVGPSVGHCRCHRPDRRLHAGVDRARHRRRGNRTRHPLWRHDGIGAHAARPAPAQGVRRALRIIGIDPLPAEPASALLEFTILGSATGPVLVPQGFQVGGRSADGTGGMIILETQNNLYATAAQITQMQVQEGSFFLDVTPDPNAPTPFSPFGSSPKAGTALYLGLGGGVPQIQVSIGFNVVTPAGTPAPVASGGLTPLPAVPTPTLVWETYDGGSGSFQTAPVVSDSTLGLAQSGVVVLTVPPVWNPGAPLGLDPSSGLLWLRLRIVQGQFDPPPVVSDVLLNVVQALAVQTVAGEYVDFGTDTTLQNATLSQAPVLPGSLIITVLDDPLSATDTTVWQETQDLALARSDQQVYEFDPATGQITFGDGVHGAAVPPGFRNVVATYQAISPSSGVLAANSVTTLINSAPFITGVNNPNPGSGGTEVGSQAEAIALGPQIFRAKGRAVTTADFALLATEVAGIVKAHAIAGRHPAYPGKPIPGVVGVYVVPPDTNPTPGQGAAPMPTSETLEAVATNLSTTAALAGIDVVVAAPVYHYVQAQVAVVAQPLGRRRHGLPGRSDHPDELPAPDHRRRRRQRLALRRPVALHPAHPLPPLERPRHRRDPLPHPGHRRTAARPVRGLRDR